MALVRYDAEAARFDTFQTQSYRDTLLGMIYSKIKAAADDGLRFLSHDVQTDIEVARFLAEELGKDGYSCYVRTELATIKTQILEIKW